MEGWARTHSEKRPEYNTTDQNGNDLFCCDMNFFSIRPVSILIKKNPCQSKMSALWNKEKHVLYFQRIIWDIPHKNGRSCKCHTSENFKKKEDFLMPNSVNFNSEKCFWIVFIVDDLMTNPPKYPFDPPSADWRRSRGSR